MFKKDFRTNIRKAKLKCRNFRRLSFNFHCFFLEIESLNLRLKKNEK